MPPNDLSLIFMGMKQKNDEMAHSKQPSFSNRPFPSKLTYINEKKSPSYMTLLNSTR